MERLGINGGFLLAQIVNFGLVALVLWALAWKPLVAALEARREKIAKGLEDARAAELARAKSRFVRGGRRGAALGLDIGRR